MIVAKDLASGFNVEDYGARIICESCIKEKSARKPFPKKTDRKTKRPLELVHIDLCGPMSTVTPRGNKYFMTVIDDYSRFTAAYLLKEKSEAANKIRQYVRWTENLFGYKVSAIRSDGEYANKELLQFYESEGIKAQFTTLYAPQQNGVAERKNRTLTEMTNCMLLDADLPKRYWDEAITTVVYLQNRLPSRSVERTSYELWTNQKPEDRKSVV